jgi:hypothetical protein
MPDWPALAAQIRMLIHAQAPGLDHIAAQAPDGALLAMPAAALAVVLLIAFALLGALVGGKNNKARRAAALEVEDEDDDLPAPARVARSPPPAADKGPDKRTEAVLDALERARAPGAEAPSAEERQAQERAAARVLKDSPIAAKAIAAGDVGAGLDKLDAEAAALASAGKPRAAQAWRDLGALAEGVDDARALSALETAFAIEPSDFWANVFLARQSAKAGKFEQALAAAQAGASHAKGPREKAIGQAETGDANMSLRRIEPARAAYQGAIEALRLLARSGERRAQHDLSVGLSKLGDLEHTVGDLPKARALYEEDLTIARHLAKTNAASLNAQRNVVISLVKVAAVTNDRACWIEARDAAEALARAGKLLPSDAPLLEGLRKHVAAG